MNPKNTASETQLDSQVDDDNLTAESLVEEVSIDGMCGVY